MLDGDHGTVDSRLRPAPRGVGHRRAQGHSCRADHAGGRWQHRPGQGRPGVGEEFRYAQGGTRRRAETVAVKEPAGEPASPALNAGGTSLLQARTVNEVVKAQTNKVRLARLKGELVDRPQAVAHVFKLARAERDAWLNWPARISAQMAAKLGVDAHTLHVALETAVREHLQELGDVRPRVD